MSGFYSLLNLDNGCFAVKLVGMTELSEASHAITRVCVHEGGNNNSKLTV